MVNDSRPFVKVNLQLPPKRKGLADLLAFHDLKPSFDSGILLMRRPATLAIERQLT
jgi:hypothetical protein